MPLLFWAKDLLAELVVRLQMQFGLFHVKFYKEKTSNRNLSKIAHQNFLIFAYVVENNLNFWILGVST